MSSGAAVSSSYCLVRSGGALFGLPASFVSEVVDWHAPTPVPLAPKQVDGVIVYQGDVLTVLCLSSLLQTAPRGPAGALVILQDPHTRERFALAVEAAEQVVSVPGTDIERNPPKLSARLEGMFAGIWQSSSELIILLDLSSLAPDKFFDQPDLPAFLGA